MISAQNGRISQSCDILFVEEVSFKRKSETSVKQTKGLGLSQRLSRIQHFLSKEAQYPPEQ